MRRGLKFLVLADAWATFALGMLGPIYAIFVEHIGGDILAASWAFFAFTFTSGAMMYFLSFWENKSRRKETLIVAGYSLIAAGCLGYVFVYNEITLLVVQVILGLGIAMLAPAYDVVYSHYVDVQREASDWGLWDAVSYMVSAIAAISGGYIAKIFGFRVLFAVMFVAALLGLLEGLNLYRQRKYLEGETKLFKIDYSNS